MNLTQQKTIAVAVVCVENTPTPTGFVFVVIGNISDMFDRHIPLGPKSRGKKF